MAKAVTTEELQVFTFLGLLAGEGQVPGACSGEIYTPFAVAAEETILEVASDLAATGDFFSLMVENGQMRAEEPAKKYDIKIVRPTSLGGGFGGGVVPAH